MEKAARAVSTKQGGAGVHNEIGAPRFFRTNAGLLSHG